MVQLAARRASNDILGIEPHSIRFLERGGRSLFLVCPFAVDVLGLEDLGLELFLDLFELPRCLMDVGFCRDRGGLFVMSKVKLPLAVMAVVREERRNTSRFWSLGVGGKLGEGQP